MSLFVASLNSGSNGNCYYLADHTDAVLIDAGISCRETERRMARLGLSMKKVRAVFISHEHSDHINGLAVLSSKYNLPVYITGPTLQQSRLQLAAHLVVSFQAYQPVHVGGIEVLPFPKSHDAAHAHSFVVSCGAVTVGVFTDIGTACTHLTTQFSKCHAAFLEANYDEALLENGRYPYHLKRRIRGGLGHLSNGQALEVFTRHRPPFMTHLFLAHLSRENNDPALAEALFRQHADGVSIVVAPRTSETAVYQINPDLAHRDTVAAGEGEPLQYRLF